MKIQESCDRIFNLPMLVYLDEREDYGEERYLGIGLLDGRIVVVIYTSQVKKWFGSSH
ncbi:BrnT family toxin [Nostoc sp. UHCC 0251]|uniref:BrnT family toxin n=1 Tax=Nostoc sp. UHCC 0251 TaxID=3110240 RepID=UPI002B205782|nr:BrnT family toxin [Nostoc sp. UHCC 0251]MEA5621370.1 BrnT family toxin [Nostoc sp. UHCC 0251]